MNHDELKPALDATKEGIEEAAETAQTSTSAFHKAYVSKVLPDCGKYGDAAKFAAEMVPGVAEYNAVREGDWAALALSAGMDAGAIASGTATGGAGYVAVKGGGEALAKQAIKEGAEVGAKKTAQELTEAGAKTVTKEVAEAGAEKVAQEGLEATGRKGLKETAEELAKKVTNKFTKEGVEETAVKEVNEHEQIVTNKLDGIAREEKIMKGLDFRYGKNNVLREQFIRDKNGEIIKDPVTGTARRLDFVVRGKDKVIKMVEVTSKTAPKEMQKAKEQRIVEWAEAHDGAFIKDSRTGELLKIPEIVHTEIKRLK
jgi:hypothetical protein